MGRVVERLRQLSASGKLPVTLEKYSIFLHHSPKAGAQNLPAARAPSPRQNHRVPNTAISCNQVLEWRVSKSGSANAGLQGKRGRVIEWKSVAVLC